MSTLVTYARKGRSATRLVTFVKIHVRFKIVNYVRRTRKCARFVINIILAKAIK